MATNGSIAPLAPDAAAQLRVIRALRDEQFDVLHVHEPLAPGPTLTAIVLKQSPIVATYHRSGPSKFYDYFNRPAKWAASRIEINCAVSEEAAKTARDALGGKYEILFNGIDLGLFHNDGPKNPNPTIFFVGRHEPRKGLEVLIRSMDYLPDEVNLWVASEGPETNRLKDLANGDRRISWLGTISDSEKIKRLQECSLLCAPSLGGESFGIVLLEAMAAGTPVVASSIPGYAKLARGGADAILTKTGDPISLSDGLRLALYNSKLTKEIVDSGRNRAEQFSMEKLANQYIEIYQRARSIAPSVPLAKGRQFFSGTLKRPERLN
tara:strand:+ start:218 stop:1186 length:969 start_codon:yes stop_codon:yes gene_type:complete